MTLPPERIGDSGQRYVVQSFGWPKHDVQDWQNCAYSNNAENAQQMMNALLFAPGNRQSRVIDRQAGAAK